MVNNIFRKGLVLVLIVLIIGVIIAPITAGNVKKPISIDKKEFNTPATNENDYEFVYPVQNLGRVGWWDNNWSYRKQITINHNMVAADLFNFPVLVHNVSSDFQNHTQIDGDDFVFITANNTNRYSHEIEYYNSSSGELVAWVNITSLSSTVDTVLYLYYGNPSCSSQQEPDNVWDSDYIHVWHLGDNLVDSAGSDDGNDHGTSIVSGKIGKGRDFEQSEHDFIDFGDMSQPADGSLTTMTWEGWIKPEAQDIVLMIKYNTQGSTKYSSYGIHLDDGGKFINYASQAIGVHTHSNTVNDYSVVGQWVYLTSTWTLGGVNDIDPFINGSEVSDNQPSSDANYMRNTPITDDIGRYRPEAGTQYTDAVIDEVRWSKIVRSDSWINTSYNNQNNSDLFMTFSFEQLQHNIVYVDDDFDENTSGWQIDHFDKIQDGIDAVNVSGTVIVYNGTYYENIVVDKSVILVGEDSNSTIVDGGDSGDVVRISAYSVKLYDFTIRNSGNNWGDACIDCVSNNNYFRRIKIIDHSTSCFGIYLHDSSNNNCIFESNISGGSEDGIYLRDSSNNNYIFGNMITGNHDGVQLYGVSNNTIINNTIVNNSDDGIGISGSSKNNHIFLNIISENNDIGIVLGGSFENRIINNIIMNNIMEGVFLDLSDNNIISGNNISNNYYGIHLDSSNHNNLTYNNISLNLENGVRLYNSSSYNLITGNIISSDNDGIRFLNSDNNIISDNTIEDNDFGIHLYGLCESNHVYHNNLLNNNYNSWDDGINTWDNGYPSGGNYWDDYTGNDTDGDCIGDTPYPIPGGDNEDRYPVMNPDGWINQPPNKPTIHGPTTGKPGVEYTYFVYTTDPNCDNLYYKWNWGDGSFSDWLGPFDSGVEVSASHAWSQGTFNITVKAMDVHDAESEWSDPLLITMPRSKAINSLFLRFLERFPLLQRLLSIFEVYAV